MSKIASVFITYRLIFDTKSPFSIIGSISPLVCEPYIWLLALLNSEL